VIKDLVIVLVLQLKMTTLSRGAISKIFNGEQPKPVTFQLLALKPFPAGNGYKLMVSDGLHKSAMAVISAASPVMPLVESGDVTVNCVFTVNKYGLTNAGANKKKVMVLSDVKVETSAADAGGVMGAPVPYEDKTEKENQGASPAPNGRVSVMRASTPATPSPGKRAREDVDAPMGLPSVRPISALTPYQNKWSICARVTGKSDVKTWNNAKSSGKLFSFDLLDDSAEIKVSAFNEQCDKFNEMLEVGKVYFLSGGVIKMANKRFSNSKHDYELSLSNNSQIIESSDDAGLPTMQYDFVALNEMQNAEKNTLYDVCGVCHKASDASDITIKSTGMEVRKREIHIVDTSNTSVAVTLWGDAADKFDGSSNPVVVIKAAVAREFNGVSLSVGRSSTLTINPDLPEAHQLKGWWEATGNAVTNFSSLGGSRSTEGFGNAPFMTFEEAKASGQGHGDKFDYYANKVTVVLVRKENMLYMACPGEKCMKKVTDMNNGMYRCEKCNESYDSFKWRLMASCCLADCTGDTWTSVFQDMGEKILGMSAQELGELRQSDDAKFQSVVSAAAFREFTVKLRAKTEVYNDESRVKTTIYTAAPVDHVDYNKRLLKEIKAMKSAA